MCGDRDRGLVLSHEQPPHSGCDRDRDKDSRDDVAPHTTPRTWRWLRDAVVDSSRLCRGIEGRTAVCTVLRLRTHRRLTRGTDAICSLIAVALDALLLFG